MMTKLYLFEEDGALALCETVSVPNNGLKRVEEFQRMAFPSIPGWLYDALRRCREETGSDKILNEFNNN